MNVFSVGFSEVQRNSRFSLPHAYVVQREGNVLRASVCLSVPVPVPGYPMVFGPRFLPWSLILSWRYTSPVTGHVQSLAGSTVRGDERRDVPKSL